MNIRLYKDSDKQGWDKYVYKHPNANHAHLSGWKDVIEKTYKKKSYYLLAEENKENVGILPLFHIKSMLFGNQLVSMPYLTYGGVLADSDVIAKSLIQKAVKISKELKTDFVELRHTKPLNNEIFNTKRTQTNISKVSTRLELPKSSEDLFKSFKSKLRSQVRRPQKEGMIFKLGDSDLIDEFYKVFATNMRDLGSPVHSIDLFKTIFKFLDKTVKIGIVYYKDQPVSAGIIFIFKKFVEIPWASSLKKFNRFSPNMLLYWSFLEYVTDNGFKYFDFGRSTPEEGTHNFKKQWGTRDIQLFWYKTNIKITSINQKNSKTENLQDKFIATLWKKMPLFAANIIGAKIRHSISL